VGITPRQRYGGPRARFATSVGVTKRTIDAGRLSVRDTFGEAQVLTIVVIHVLAAYASETRR
jgi:hypothetical protein